ncbi:MAG: hypothetical protein QOG43_3234 [Actinomycetota bacterium]|jgi:hypothetical protein|nr:hypothetical protein [Actinomycetota bacterium]
MVVRRLKNLLAPIVLPAESAFWRSVGRLRRLRRSGATVETDLSTFLDVPPGQASVITPAGVNVSGQRRLARLRVGRGPLTCRVEPDALFVPLPQGCSAFTHHGLYDAAGALIPESCVYRGVDSSQRMTVDQGGRLPVGADVDSSDEAVIYLGFLVDHYGHFLTECLARVWYALDERPDLRLLAHGAAATTYARRLFAALDIRPDRFVVPDRATRFRQVHIPQPTFVERFMLHERHLAVTRRAARRILEGETLQPSAQPVYLSRARLGVHPRKLYGEVSLIRHLRRAGVLIVDPQDLDLEQQVRLFNEHEVIIGPIGSAHHTTALALAPRHHVYLCNWASENFVLFDLLTGNRAHYLQLTPPVRSLQRKPNHLLDVALTLSVLRDLGVIPTRNRPGAGRRPAPPGRLPGLGDEGDLLVDMD